MGKPNVEKPITKDTTDLKDAAATTETDKDVKTTEAVVDDKTSFTEVNQEIEKPVIKAQAKTEEEIVEEVVEEVEKAHYTDEERDELAKLIANPEEYKEDLKREVKESIQAEDRELAAKKENTNSFWKSFYKENPQLEKDSKVVDMVFSRVRDASIARGEKLNHAQGVKLLAKAANDLINSIRNENYEEVDTTLSTTGVSSSASAAPQEVKKPVKKSNFCNQVSSFKEARGL